MWLLRANEKHDQLLPMPSFVLDLSGVLIRLNGRESFLLALGSHDFLPHKQPYVLAYGGLALGHHGGHTFPNGMRNGFIGNVRRRDTLDQLVSIQLAQILGPFSLR